MDKVSEATGVDFEEMAEKKYTPEEVHEAVL
jgi:hypothetical protein